MVHGKNSKIEGYNNDDIHDDAQQQENNPTSQPFTMLMEYSNTMHKTV